MQTEALDRLRQFVARPGAASQCDLCPRAIAEDHEHVVDPGQRRVMCTCSACAILFSGASGVGRKRVPRRVRCLDAFRLTDAQWDSLRLPINLAFFVNSTPDGRVVAYYPSPGGATESLLPLDAWEEVIDANPEVADLEADVEALLANRIGPPEYFIAPIDRCYELVGLIRSTWSGLSGGTEVWKAINGFFADLRRRA